MQTERERRAFFRLWYPRTERPQLLLGDLEYPVLELSEGGAKVSDGRGHRELPQGEYSGTLVLVDGTTVPVRCVFLRKDGELLAIQFTTPIGMRRMIAEQRRLLQKYPCLRDQARAQGTVSYVPVDLPAVASASDAAISIP